ncbi:MAG: bifunctional phosphoribosyl-AMP cyclohydrolase/phosphoribosyl-ATP diphosphatase HisIE [Chloroflexi bacterium]|nr:bifunctional phosphoribosyl-AMP cyclohydrolase/phosphoribosyl-ATP diphosphatase HisIE [Chloroflexota bacterium]
MPASPPPPPVFPLDPEAVRWGRDGLVPAIVQDVADGRVLMLAWQDREALEATLRTGEVHFHSRSRDRLWRKGESSGHVLRLMSATIDCDGDAILLTAEPTGPACHTGARSCFDHPTDGPEPITAPQGFAWLETLWSTIADRAATRPAGSYTTRLLEGGVDAAARKVAEEATEVVLAAKDHAAAPSEGTGIALAGELADLLYHVLVLAAERETPPTALIAELRRRHDGG